MPSKLIGAPVERDVAPAPPPEDADVVDVQRLVLGGARLIAKMLVFALRDPTLRAEIASLASIHGVPGSQTPAHLTVAEYAHRSNVSKATVGRWLVEGLPSLPVGSTVRIDPVEADAWRRARGRKPTRAAIPPPAADDLDLDQGGMQRAGLRLVGKVDR